ncbi:MAG: hypothetical protein E3J22_07110 [Candidatus Aminicenantes bacterium]|nr:MAG: hypothetical protein E3J22_07110 [Candidatus Aminicenantes bacterium]
MKTSVLTIRILLVLTVLFCLANCKKKGTDELPLLASYDFEDSHAEGWQPSIPDHWRVVEKDGSMVYELVSPGIQGEIRAPTSWSILPGHDITSFELMGRLKCKTEASNPHRDMCIIFHFQDPTHFYYVHFSASSDSLHNIVGLVNGADRVKINSELPGESVFRLTDMDWHRFKVSYDAETGDIKAFLDDMDTPILTACDKTLNHGFVGIGSFDDTGYFDDITLKGKKHLTSDDS